MYSGTKLPGLFSLLIHNVREIEIFRSAQELNTMWGLDSFVSHIINRCACVSIYGLLLTSAFSKKHRFAVSCAHKKSSYLAYKNAPLYHLIKNLPKLFNLWANFVQFCGYVSMQRSNDMLFYLINFLALSACERFL